MRRLLAARRRPSLEPPPAHDYPAGLIRAQAELAKADDTLTRLERQEPEVDRLATTARELHRQNHLGPAVMKALGARRTT